MISGHLSIRFGFRGPNLAIVTACTTGLHCIGEAARLIEYGDADVMVAGGAEATVSPLGVGGFAAARALSQRNDDPATASRPWDKDRDGFVLGEGAGVMVLEEYEHAKARGAKIYAEVAGFGMSADAYHMTAPLKRRRRTALHGRGIAQRGRQRRRRSTTSTRTARRRRWATSTRPRASSVRFGDHAKKRCREFDQVDDRVTCSAARAASNRCSRCWPSITKCRRRRSTSSTRTRNAISTTARTRRGEMKIDVALKN